MVSFTQLSVTQPLGIQACWIDKGVTDLAISTGRDRHRPAQPDVGPEGVPDNRCNNSM